MIFFFFSSAIWVYKVQSSCCSLKVCHYVKGCYAKATQQVAAVMLSPVCCRQFLPAFSTGHYKLHHYCSDIPQHFEMFLVLKHRLFNTTDNCHCRPVFFSIQMFWHLIKWTSDTLCLKDVTAWQRTKREGYSIAIFYSSESAHFCTHTYN